MRRAGRLDEWIASRRAFTREIAELASEPRSPRRKPRSPEEHAILERAAVATIERARATGRIARLGPRHYAIRIDDTSGPRD